MTIRAYVPCETVMVTVTLGPEKGLSLLEETLLKTIGKGLSDIDGLNAIFQIGYRTLMSLIYGMWHQGYLQLDPDSGRIDLVDEVAKQLKKGELVGFNSTDLETITLEIMQEKVTGHLLFLHRSASNRNPYRIIPSQISDGGWSCISSERILPLLERLVKQFLKRENKPHENRRIVSWRFGRGQEGVGEVIGHPRLMELTLTPHLSFSKKQQIRITNPTELPPNIRHSLEQAIENLLDRGEETPFGKDLLRQMEKNPNGESESEARTDILARKLEKLNQTLESRHRERHLSREQILEAHGELESRAMEVTQEVKNLLDSRMALEFLRDREAFHNRLGELISCARKRVIITLPKPHWPSFNGTLYTPITRLLNRNKEARIWLYWGITPDDRLSVECQTCWGELSQQYAERFFWSEQPTAVRANLVLADNRHILFSTTGIESGEGLRNETPASLGLLMTPLRGDNLPVPAIDLLNWLIPRFGEALATRGMFEAVLRPPLEQEKYADSASLSFRDWSFPKMPGWVQAKRGAEESAVPVSSFDENSETRLWMESWNNCRNHLQTLATIDDYVSWVFHGGTHLEYVYEAVSRVKRRLLLISPAPHPQIMDHSFCEKIRKAADERSVEVLLVFPPPSAGEKTLPEDCAEILQHQRIHFLARRWNGGLVLWDDKCLMGALDPLSLRVVKEPKWNKRSQELGLLAHSRALCDQIWHVMHHSLATPPPSRLDSSLSQKIRNVNETNARIQRRQRLYDELAGKKTGTNEIRQALGNWFEQESKEGDIWKAWEELRPLWEKIGIVDVLAAALHATGYQSGNSTYATMRRLLAQRCWHERQYAQSALLWDAEDDHHVTTKHPPGLLVRLVAWNCTRSPATEFLVDFAKQLESWPGATLALFFIATLRLLKDADPNASSLLQKLGDLDSFWASWNEGILAYWKSTSQALSPYRNMMGTQIASIHASALTKFEQTKAVKVGYPAGEKSWVWLFQPSSPMGRLGLYLSTKDQIGLQNWLTECYSPEFLIDWGYNDLKSRKSIRGAPIEGGRRNNMMAKLAETIQAAQRWLICSRSEDAISQDQHMKDTAKLIETLLGRSQDNWPKLEDARCLARTMVGQEHFSAPLAIDLLDWLSQFADKRKI